MTRWLSMPPWCVVAIALFAAACPDSAPPTEGAVVGGLPRTVAQTVREGGPNPTVPPLKIINQGPCPMVALARSTTASGGAWLATSPAAPSEIQVGANGSVEISVTIDVTGLTPGTYSGNITITAACVTTGQPARGSPAVVDVNLTVTPLDAVLATDRTEIDEDVVALQNRWTLATLAGPGNLYDNTGTAVWTGRRAILFGNRFGASIGSRDGFLYDPADGAWEPLPEADSHHEWGGHSAVWTGTEVIYWGGCSVVGGLGSCTQSGAAFNPAARTWRSLPTTGAPSSRSDHLAVWTGTEMIVVGGSGQGETGGIYTPGASGDGTWRSIDPGNEPGSWILKGVWTGTRLLVFPERFHPEPLARMAAKSLDPTTGTWSALPSTNAPTERYGFSVVWTGSRALLFGGRDASGPRNDLFYYDAVRKRWGTLVGAHAPPTGRYEHVAVWTGNRMIVWGGVGGSGPNYDTPQLSGGIWDRANWTDVTATLAPLAFPQYSRGLWTGTALVVFPLGSGAIYHFD